jgi:potassium/hydrogen antiporter
LLLGAIISSTDAAAVYSILKSRQIAINRRIKFLLEFEAGSNDPMAIFLTFICINYILSHTMSGFDLAFVFLSQLLVGLFVGYATGRFIPYLFDKINLEYPGLYPVLNVGLILLAYGVATALNGNGFLAVYITGLMMSRSEFQQKQNLYKFHDGFVWLMQIVMFLILGLQIFPSQLPAIFKAGILVSIFLIFVGRPLAVFTILSFSKLSLKEKAFVSWTGLRGAVPIILATFPVIAGVPGAEIIFDIVFFVVISSVLIQGTLLPAVARRLNSDEE